SWEDFVGVKGWVSLLGGYRGYGAGTPDARDVGIYPSVLSGDIGAANDSVDNSYHVVNAGGTDLTTILDGFTIMDGAALPKDNASNLNGWGAGLINIGGSPDILNCTFSGNAAETGG